MSLAPDYGLKMLAMGYRPDVEINLYPFMMFVVGSMGHGRFTTSSRTPVDGVDHSLSLDFDSETLETILTLCPSIRSEVEEWLSREPAPTDPLQLSAPVRFGVTAKIGTLQRGQGEDFVPLVIQDVFACQ